MNDDERLLPPAPVASPTIDAFAMWPGEELYDLANDPGQLVNLAGQKQTSRAQQKLRDEMM